MQIVLWVVNGSHPVSWRTEETAFPKQEKIPQREYLDFICILSFLGHRISDDTWGDTQEPQMPPYDK